LEGRLAEARAAIGKAESLLPAAGARSYLRRQIEDEKRALGREE
jgi:hypothetical protein